MACGFEPKCLSTVELSVPRRVSPAPWSHQWVSIILESVIGSHTWIPAAAHLRFCIVDFGDGCEKLTGDLGLMRGAGYSPSVLFGWTSVDSLLASRSGMTGAFSMGLGMGIGSRGGITRRPGVSTLGRRLVGVNIVWSWGVGCRSGC